MLASVIICTYNRSKLLEESLLSACRQDFAADQYEIVVVDNNSSDNTRQIVQEVASSSKVKISYLFEKRQGLSFARNSGIDAAQGEIVVFTDDDIEAEPQWLRETVAAFSIPEVACAGGPIRPLWPLEKPQWLNKEQEGFLTISEFEAAREAGRFSYPNYPWGANIAFRKTVLGEVGTFPTHLGRIGASLLSNEELDLCDRIEAAGYIIAFAPEAVIHHKIPAERMTKSWMMHRAYWQGRSDAILDMGKSLFRYSRLRDFARQLFCHRTKDRGVEITTICIERNLMGYLHQLLIVSQDPPLSQFRKIRVIRTFLSSFTKLTGASFTEKENELAERDQQIEQLKVWLSDRVREIHDRDQWLAQRDNQIGQYRQWLTDRERDLRDRDQWLAERDSQIPQYKQWLTDKERDIQDREQWLAERDGQIAQYKQWLADRELNLRDRDQWLAECGSHMAQHKQWLADRERDISDRDQWLAERDGQIAQYKQWLADRELNLRDRDQRLAEQDTQIAQHKQSQADREREILDFAQILADKDGEIHDRDELLADQERRLGQYAQLLDERDKQIADLDTRLSAKRKWLAESREAITIRNVEIADLHGKLYASNQMIEGLLDSISWKITAPLRWFSHNKAIKENTKSRSGDV